MLDTNKISDWGGHYCKLHHVSIYLRVNPYRNLRCPRLVVAIKLLKITPCGRASDNGPARKLLLSQKNVTPKEGWTFKDGT